MELSINQFENLQKIELLKKFFPGENYRKYLYAGVNTQAPSFNKIKPSEWYDKRRKDFACVKISGCTTFDLMAIIFAYAFNMPVAIAPDEKDIQKFYQKADEIYEKIKDTHDMWKSRRPPVVTYYDDIAWDVVADFKHGKITDLDWYIFLIKGSAYHTIYAQNFTCNEEGELVACELPSSDKSELFGSSAIFLNSANIKVNNSHSKDKQSIDAKVAEMLAALPKEFVAPLPSVKLKTLMMNDYEVFEKEVDSNRVIIIGMCDALAMFLLCVTFWTPVFILLYNKKDPSAESWLALARCRDWCFTIGYNEKTDMEELRKEIIKIYTSFMVGD